LGVALLAVDEGREPLVLSAIRAPVVERDIVRFNGAYGGSSMTTTISISTAGARMAERTNGSRPSSTANKADAQDAQTKRMAFKPFKAQTRLWGYALGHAWEEQEMSNVLVEAATPVKIRLRLPTTYSPLQAERSWRRQAEDNVADSMERLALMAPYGDVDKLLEDGGQQSRGHQLNSKSSLTSAAVC